MQRKVSFLTMMNNIDTWFGSIVFKSCCVSRTYNWNTEEEEAKFNRLIKRLTLPIHSPLNNCISNVQNHSFRKIHIEKRLRLHFSADYNSKLEFDWKNELNVQKKPPTSFVHCLDKLLTIKKQISDKKVYLGKKYVNKCVPMVAKAAK